jgi:hypothetical protein
MGEQNDKPRCFVAGARDASGHCIEEVVDFVAWVKHRKLSTMPETMLLSEAALSKDWDTPEEDEAWANL